MRFLKQKSKLVLLACIMIGCNTPQEYAAELDYAKDERTGLCFAMWGMGGNGSTLTIVPCTGAVEEQIRQTKMKHAKR